MTGSPSAKKLTSPTNKNFMPTRIEQTESGRYALKSKRTGETHSTHDTSEQANEAQHKRHVERMETRTSSDFTDAPHRVEPPAFKVKAQSSDAKEQKFE
jgi:hypothetical protein